MPLLRWEFVRKGYALMHGACIALDDQALLITARTDTGKTTTILQIIREHAGRIQFLSDDMTILSKDGQVMNFPKPLTISKHTLRAANCSELTLKERLFLQVQSRLHSRGGRMFGMWLSQGKIPAATLNAVVQAIIPPPKYMVDRLIPGAPITQRAQLSCIAVIERGPEFEREIGEQEKLRTLLTNAKTPMASPPTLRWRISCRVGWVRTSIQPKERLWKRPSAICPPFTSAARTTTGINGCQP
jgi:dolichol-phosphate mannosyltransferase